MEKIKAVFFAASPAGGSRLMIEEEIRAITQKIRAAEYRDSIELVPALAAQTDDLIQTLNQHKPQIVHFTAHGRESGEILLLDHFGYFEKTVNPNAMHALFKVMKDNIRVVILNACYAKLQAQEIIKVVDCAIGIGNPITNQAAIIFSASFYRAIGFGRSVQEAYDQSLLALKLEGIDAKNFPELLVKEGVDPSELFLVKAPPSPPPPPPPLEQGLEYLELQKYEEAFEIFQKVKESTPEDEKAQILYCLSFLIGKPIRSIKRPKMNEITITLKKIAQGKDQENSNLARIILGIIWFDYYVKEDHRYQESFFRENKRYLGNYHPSREEKQLVSHISPSENAGILFNLD